jgi:hypothetical protein
MTNGLDKIALFPHNSDTKHLLQSLSPGGISMKRGMATFAGLLVACLWVSGLAMDQAPVMQRMGAMPLAFTKNMGQWNRQVLFRANTGGATVWFCKDRVVYQFVRHIERDGDADGRGALHVPAGTRSVPLREEVERDSVEQLVITAKFVGANPNVEVIGEGLMEYKCNYFIGNDPAKWRTDVANYEEVVMKGIYLGVDLRFDSYANGQAGYEFVAAKSADLAGVQVEYEGVEGTTVDTDGRMILETRWGDVIAAFNRNVSKQSDLDAFLFDSGNTTGPSFRDVDREPVKSMMLRMSYGTYLGGSSDDIGCSIALDALGSAYVSGQTYSQDFPSGNGYDSTINIDPDGFVTKVSVDGHSLVYSTYLGGSDLEQANAIAVDRFGCTYVSGRTFSTDFPVSNPFQTDQPLRDGFVTKLSPQGNTLTYSTYLGGSSEDYINAIAIDGNGCAYVTGYTGSHDFPLINPYQPSHSAVEEIFLTKLSTTGSSLEYSTYLGLAGSNNGCGIAVDSMGCAYVIGYTNDPGFPVQSAFQGVYGGGEYDAFVTKFSAAGNSLAFSTLLGGSGRDLGCGIALDDACAAYLTGTTTSPNFPTMEPFQGTYSGAQDAFVGKLAPSGGSLQYSTYLGGTGEEQSSLNYAGIAVDSAGCAYVAGPTNSADFPTVAPLMSFRGGYDLFVTKFASSGSSVEFSTYLGGSSDDMGWSVAVHDPDKVYICGRTGSSDFPTTAEAFDCTYGGGYDAFASKLVAYGDTDGDSIPDDSDNCPTVANPDQADLDHDGLGDVCDPDVDGDIIPNTTDNCPWVYNPDQHDTDDDGVGDVCDNCKTVANHSQGDADHDGFGDACDHCAGFNDSLDTDHDLIPDNCDNCVAIANPSQADCDSDGVGDACEVFLCGDANGDGAVDISDAVFLIAHIFSGGLAPCPPAAGDANCDLAIDISDAVYLIAFIFSGGPAPCEGCLK